MLTFLLLSSEFHVKITYGDHKNFICERLQNIYTENYTINLGNADISGLQHVLASHSIFIFFFFCDFNIRKLTNHIEIFYCFYI